MNTLGYILILIGTVAVCKWLLRAIEWMEGTR